MNVAKKPELITNPRLWIHEFVELTVEELLHTEFHEDSESTWDRDESKEMEPPIYHLLTGDHAVAHILSALTTTSGYYYRRSEGTVIEPVHYARLLPWGAWKRRSRD